MSFTYENYHRTRTKVCGYKPLSYSLKQALKPLDLLIELYPLVPFPPSVDHRSSVYTWTILRWTPMTVAEARTHWVA